MFSRLSTTVLTLIAVPVLDLWLAWQVMAPVGARFWSLEVVASAALGLWLSKHEASRAAARSSVQGRPRELAEAAISSARTGLLVFPGLLSDLLGLLLCVPATRKLLGSLVLRGLGVSAPSAEQAQDQPARARRASSFGEVPGWAARKAQDRRRPPAVIDTTGYSVEEGA